MAQKLADRPPKGVPRSGAQGLMLSPKGVPSYDPLGDPWKGNRALGPLFDTFNGEAKPPGLLVPGNIDIYTRPVAHNPDGSISTVRSITITDNNGRAILLPTVTPDGKVVSNESAIWLWQHTGQHLGIFKNETAANKYAVNLHDQQAQQYLPSPKRRSP